jgi:hypothetical protein
MPETYDHTENDKIAAVLVGRRIVRAEEGEFDFPGRDRWTRPDGRLVLDDGTELYLTGNDGGCSCSAGCYPLHKVATVDNVITSARVECDPHDDEEPWFGEGARENGAYRIFVIADNTEINVAEFVGSDGNGYYGTGFSLTVVRPVSSVGPEGDHQ